MADRSSTRPSASASPEKTLAAWCADFDLEHTTRADLDPHYDAVEAFAGVAPTPDAVQGARNLLFKGACDALGYSSEPIARSVRGCRGSGECFTGCRSRAKQSADLTWVPAAIRAGALVVTSAQVREVIRDGRRAAGVAGRFVEPFTGRASHSFRVRAKVVVLAAGCMATPVLLRRNGGLANASGQVGENLQFHPGTAAMGIFPDRTHPQFGATQGYQSLHFVGEGFKLETLWTPPGLLAVRIPGAGYALKEHLAEIPFSAEWDAIISSNRSLGRVVPRRSGMDPVLHWRFHPDDFQILVRALRVLVEMLFAAGARKVIHGVHGLPDAFGSLAEADVLRARPIAPTDVVCAANHAFSTTRMHGDPRHGVVDELGRCHDVDNLYVADSGVLPRSPSVNPMLTTMALAHRTARAIADRT